MSCNHLIDCLRCGGIFDDMEERMLSAEAEVDRLTDDLKAERMALEGAIARVAELEARCTCRRKLDGPPTKPGWYWQVSTGTMYNGPRQLDWVDINDGWPGAFPDEVTWYGPICEPEDANERDER